MIALALTWERPHAARAPFVCFADDTIEGQYETVGNDYDMAYSEGMAAGAAAAAPGSAAARAAAARAAAARAAAARAAAARAAALARPGMPAPSQYAAANQAAAEARIRAIVQEEIRRAVPYGDVPPRPNPEEAMFPMGLGFVTLTSLVPSLALEAKPQRAFRGERLVLAIFASPGAAGAIALIDDFVVGDYKQLVGGGSLPASIFASDSFGVRLMLDASIPGVLYRVLLTGLAIPPGEFIIVSGAVIGRAGEAAQR